MASKDFFLIVDTETTIGDKVADFGAIITDRKGKIHAQAGVLIREFFLDRANYPLFHDNSIDPLWGARNLPKRYAEYDAMLSDGRRMLASVPALNRWLARAKTQYNPVLTAYNLAFDKSKCSNSGIDLDLFDRRFCLWHHSANKWAKTKAFRQFALDSHCFNKPTKLGNMTYLTNAEVMARFILDDPTLEDEPHTALEDARDYELPILLALIKKQSTKKLLEQVPGYNWREFQVKDWFKAA
jgi:hypothetical protein